jgi:hypothetical protein
MGMEHWWNDTDSGKLKYWERNLSLLVYAPQIPHGLTCDRTRTSAVRGRQRTTQRPVG